MNKILAKSIGIDLIKHSKNVNLTSNKIINKILKEPNELTLEVIKLGSLLHDIGKTTEEFQKMLTGKIKKSKNKFRHNEIGWAFLYRYLNVNSEILKQVLDAVYWHHGISNRLNNNNHFEILESISDNDIENMKSILIELLGIEYCLVIPRDQDNYNGEKTPLYYPRNDSNNFQNFIINRTCIISADKLTSKLEEINALDKVDEFINEYLHKQNEYVFNECPFEYCERFEKQLEIVGECDKTTIIKAPAGFGKTLTGLIWSSKSNKKLIWVCPRNAVALSVYNSVLNELETFGLKVNIELFLSGEVKRSNHTNCVGFSSDIIITNIDNFLAPTVDSRISDRLFLINNTDVIFDEYHELVGEAALFSSFISMMRVRNRYTDCRTLLLSASPIKMEFLWDSINQSTKVLPNNNEHYLAAHDKKYLLNVTEELINVNGDNNLIIYNSISQAQINKKRYQCGEIIHSLFLPEELDNKIENLLTNYGKKSLRLETKRNLVGTHIIQASLDVSFKNLYESVLSPESTVQRCGRCDRWGDYLGVSTLNIFKVPNNKSENMIRDILYNRNISDTWFDYLLGYNGKEISLNELYVMYNDFNNKNASVIKNYIIRKHNDSLDSLERIYPIKFNETTNTDTLTAGSNKLRSFGNEIFFITQIYGSDEYTSPFNTRIYDSISKDFNETDNPLPRIKGVFKKLIKEDDIRFNYNDLMDNKNITLDAVRLYGKKSDTPYVRFDKVYHKEFGLVNIELLDRIIN